jgi:hypothetical protein
MTRKRKTKRNGIPVSSIPVSSIPVHGKGISLKDESKNYGTAWKGVGKGWKKSRKFSKHDNPKTITPFNTFNPDKLAQTMPPTFKPHGSRTNKSRKKRKKRHKKTKRSRR